LILSIKQSVKILESTGFAKLFTSTGKAVASPLLEEKAEVSANAGTEQTRSRVPQQEATGSAGTPYHSEDTVSSGLHDEDCFFLPVYLFGKALAIWHQQY